MRTLVMAAFLAIPVIASAQPTFTLAPGLVASPAAQEVQGLERQLHEAYVKGDKARIRSQCAEDATFTFQTGRTLGPDEHVKAIPAYPDLRVTVDNVRLYGGHTAIVNGKAALANADGTQSLLQTVRVWVKQGEAWKVAVWQTTRLK